MTEALPTRRQEDFYQQARARVRVWAASRGARPHKAVELVMAGPDLFHLMCRLVADPRVPRKEKGKLAFAIGYFMSPLDLLPEMVLGPLGWVDDVALSAWAIRNVIEAAGPDVVREHWAGDDDVLELTRFVITAADERLGSGLWRRVRGLLEGERRREIDL